MSKWLQRSHSLLSWQHPEDTSDKGGMELMVLDKVTLAARKG